MSDLQIFTDGGSRGNPGPAATGVVVYKNSVEIAALHRFLGSATNNEAEYQAVLDSLTWLSTYLGENSADVSAIVWNLDSKLVVEQLNKKWKIKEPRMKIFAEQVWQKLKELPIKTVSFRHIPRELNKRADELVNAALDLR